MFEASKKESDESLKNFLRNGLSNTSVTCVLAGAHTWTRRWVRYEIVRSILRGNGMLTVDIDGIKNNDGLFATKGPNPLDQVGLYKTDRGIYFAEWNGQKWVKYKDYALAIPETELWFNAPEGGSVAQLSKHCLRYDFAAQNGRTNIGNWIETAATMAGR